MIEDEEVEDGVDEDEEDEEVRLWSSFPPHNAWASPPPPPPPPPAPIPPLLPTVAAVIHGSSGQWYPQVISCSRPHAQPPLRQAQTDVSEGWGG